ncbi:hypothetical protein [Chitinophaga pinensis]|uniref:Uncharacterized protein n=1 Tax=Chitinophaga pinensis TaxID=79329 RepID=A0A5C6LL02_9BACT|nr:hypothetical protein [Chitinophaga pinensis]TWV93605.1 hypothetical protein FEF09_26940 [Chitinophaga pinensis]
MSIATYSFLPYLRQGLANGLQSSGGARGTFTVDLKVRGDSTTAPVEQKKVEIYGPGDIVGIDPRAIVKTDPHPWITNFEPNYLAYIDFYSEDYPWRYTPVQATGKRLNPWISLVVLAEGEFTEVGQTTGRPLPAIKLSNPGIRDFFPKADQLWAWAHVHMNGDLTASDSTILVDGQAAVDAALDKLQATLNNNADMAYSRLMCPRKLLPSTPYHAFVIPSYESGRLAGLGADPAAIAAAALNIGWQQPNVEFPYYYRWQFNTGKEGDFEYLVRLLKPKVADSRVGRRVMDMTRPGANLKWQEDPAHNLGGILRLGGALQVPDEALTDEEIEKKEKFDKWAIRNLPALHPFQVQLAGFLNLADDYNLLKSADANVNAKEQSQLDIDPNEDQDPLITPPIYGKWHAMAERVYVDRNGTRIDNNYNWLNELNLDPRFRVPAHFGTRVVQENQEDYMEAAWEQIGEVLKANKKIRFAQFGMAAATALYNKNLIEANAVSAPKTLLLTAPVQKRIMFNNATVFHNMRQSVLPNTILSAPMRRIVRPRGRIAFHLEKQLPAGEKIRLETVVTKINDGEILPAPPKTVPPALPTVDEVAGSLGPNIPPFLKDLLRRHKWLPLAALGIAILIILLLLLFGAGGGLWAVGVVIAAGFVYLWRLLSQWAKALNAAEAVASDNLTPASVDEMPKSTDFHLTDIGDTFRPNTGNTDSANSVKFKQSLKDMYRLFEGVKADIPAKRIPVKLDLQQVATTVVTQLQPQKTIPAWIWQQVFFPPWIRDQIDTERFTEAMAYPKINKPMYEELKKISDELFLPNVDKIERNSMTLLETNQRFIESYMVGLNHEFARELLWREYPTDQRGSYFRQFWDVSSVLKDPALQGKAEEIAREPYYDIPKLHFWRRASKLGDHDHRQPPGEPPKEEIVLVIRGELLKKYPTTVVYAHKAIWSKNSNGQFDVKLIRSLHMQAEGDKEKPDPEVVRTPLYQAKIDPDIYFFGFDLTVDEAKGENEPANPTLENAGWFFVLKERPGEARFGLDVTATDGGNQNLVSWNDLDWARVLPGDGAIDVLNLPAPLTLPASAPPVTDPNNTEETGQRDQYLDDKQITWDSNVDAANLAYILYQVPMMVCTHAADMLLKK